MWKEIFFRKVQFFLNNYRYIFQQYELLNIIVGRYIIKLCRIVCLCNLF